jgi:DNA-directed RNA polymerase
LADLTTICDGLNALGEVPWQINNQILSVARQCWQNNISLGDIPTRTDLELPSKPVRPEILPKTIKKDSVEYAMHQEASYAYKESLAKYRRLRQKNMVRFFPINSGFVNEMCLILSTYALIICPLGPELVAMFGLIKA